MMPLYTAIATAYLTSWMFY